MKLAHNVNLRVFSYEGEDEKRIADTLAKLCPFDLAQEKLQMTRTVDNNS
jgi:RNA binding exosome subunit